MSRQCGTFSSYIGGCRCTLCRKANTLHSQQMKERLRNREPRVHGTAYAYNTYRCRCEECCAAWSAFNTATALEWRKRNPKESKVHGKYSTYINHHCRCPECMEAMRIYYKKKTKP